MRGNQKFTEQVAHKFFAAFLSRLRHRFQPSLARACNNTVVSSALLFIMSGSMTLLATPALKYILAMNPTPV